MKKLLLLLIVITVTSISIFGQTIPKQISYQGVLKDALGNLVNGDQALTFKIYNDPTGGTTLWTEIQVINVTNGLFRAHLGASTPITGVPFDRLHFLGITIGSEPELSPRTLLTPTPYSFMAMDIMDNTVTTEKIVDATITGSDIANNTIGPEKLNFTPGSGTIGGSGTANYIPIFNDANNLGNSAIFQSGTNVGIGTTTPTRALDIESSTTGVMRAIFTGTQNDDIVAVYGRSAPALGKGYGGFFQGGNTGVYGTVATIGTSGGTYYGVYGQVGSATTGMGDRYGVYGRSTSTGSGTRYGIYGIASGGTTNWAGYFSGNMRVTGIINPAGMQSMIDHPLDPANKYLYHAVVESPDMKNIYDGNVVTDGSGYASVTLPDWFEALNKDFRYQLTVIGDFAQAIIAQEVQRNQFSIRTDKPNIKVSWQVTGIRKDAFAEKNRKPVEELKQGDEVGKYIHPNAFGLPETMGIDYEKNNPER